MADTDTVTDSIPATSASADQVVNQVLGQINKVRKDKLIGTVKGIQEKILEHRKAIAIHEKEIAQAVTDYNAGL